MIKWLLIYPPLITLFKSKQFHLLPALFPQIVVPNAVWDEILAGGESDLAAQNLPTLDWITKTELLEVSPLVLAWDLGPGESEVLSFAFSNPDYTAIVDDAAARRCARSLGIKVIGTGGLLVLAKRKGLVESIIPCIQSLKDAGLWLSNELVEILKKAAGE